MTESKIVSIKIKDGATIQKGMTMRGPGFSIQAEAVTEDGRTVTFTVESERKKNVMPSFERKQRSVAAGSMKASFNDDGAFWGTVEQFSMGSGGLTPEAH